MEHTGYNYFNKSAYQKFSNSYGKSTIKEVKNIKVKSVNKQQIYNELPKTFDRVNNGAISMHRNGMN
jgi:hypothetical protein